MEDQIDGCRMNRHPHIDGKDRAGRTTRSHLDKIDRADYGQDLQLTNLSNEGSTGNVVQYPHGVAVTQLNSALASAAGTASSACLVILSGGDDNSFAAILPVQMYT